VCQFGIYSEICQTLTANNSIIGSVLFKVTAVN